MTSSIGVIRRALLALVLLAAGAGCSGSADPDPSAAASDEAPAPARPVVVVVGDSITEGTEPLLHDALDDEVELHVRGVSGAHSREMLPASRALAPLEPDVVVVNLGTNDATTPGSSAATEAALVEHLEQFPSASCTHLVTLTELPDIPGYAETTAETNRRIRALAEERPGTEVIDWAEVLADDLAAGSPDGPLVSDDIHPTPAGAAVLVDLVADAVSGGCDRG